MTAQKVLLVSGGSRGLGAAIVKDSLGRGYKVASFSRSMTPAIESCKERFSDAFYWEKLDAEDAAQCESFVRNVVKAFGRVDVLVNNAGLGLDGLLTLARAEEIRRVIGVNLEAAIFLTKACSKVMLRQQSGTIINISSINGLRGHSGVALYSATKAALDGLTRSLARELGPANVRVNSIAPGYFESAMTDDITEEQKTRISRRTPLGRLGTVEDLLGAVRFLASDEARFITGHTLVVDGGLSC